MGGEGQEWYIRVLNLGWNQVKQLVFRGMWVLMMVLVGYGSNANRLRVWEKVNWMRFTIPTASILIRDCYLQYTNFLSLSDKGSMIVSPVTTAHTLRRKGEIKTVPVITKVPSFQIPWRSLNWLNRWGGESIFGVDCWDGSTRKWEGEKLLRYRERNC